MAMHWVVIADAVRAQVFSSGELLDKFESVAELSHPESGVKAAELVSGPRGRTNSGPNGGQSAYERHTDPHRATVDAFARQLAGDLRQGRVTGEYERLILVAPPVFLGHLRQHLDNETSRCVVASIAHDWTKAPLHTLPKLVRDGLPPTAGMPDGR